VKVECNDIGKKKNWKRNCPKCKCDIFHVEKWTRDKFEREERKCRNCSKHEDVSGKTFGYLTALTKVGKREKCGSATWMFKCVCGNEVIKPINQVKKGNGDNCGCKYKEKLKKSHGFKEYEWLYTKFKNQRKRKGIDINLSLEDFLEFTKIKKCHYCDADINWAKHSTDCGKESENHGYHLDRKDTKSSYEKENCVVCCNRCNYGKSDSFSYDEWFGMTEYLRNKKIKIDVDISPNLSFHNI
jgi:hypothetical protein